MRHGAAIEALARGLVIGIPTDTVYGLAVDPYSHGAVRRLRTLKGRPDAVPLVVMAASFEQIESMVVLSSEQRAAIRPHWPGALTAVLKASQSFADGVVDAARGTLGVRVPDHPEVHDLLAVTGPLAVTSANLSGEAPAMSATEARGLFGARVPAYLEGVCTGEASSTVIDFTTDPPELLRQGPVVL